MVDDVLPALSVLPTFQGWIRVSAPCEAGAAPCVFATPAHGLLEASFYGLQKLAMAKAILADKHLDLRQRTAFNAALVAVHSAT